MIGTIINGYKILREIGAGGMATVYYAENSLGRPVAVKILNEDSSRDPDIRSRFRSEANIMLTLDKVPGICRAIDRTEYEGRLVIVMEYLDGMTMDRYVKEKGPMRDAHEICMFGRQVLEALAQAHRMGVIHRDIKPSNLFLTSTGEAKVLDFGISKVLFGNDVDATDRETTHNQKLGTMAYMSPEQVRNTAEVDLRTDIYSFGAAIYYIVTGRDPLEIDEDSWDYIGNDKIAAALRHATRRNRDKRTSDCNTFLKELDIEDRSEKVKRGISEDSKDTEPIKEDVKVTFKVNAHCKITIDGKIESNMVYKDVPYTIELKPGKYKIEFISISDETVKVVERFNFAANRNYANNIDLAGMGIKKAGQEKSVEKLTGRNIEKSLEQEAKKELEKNKEIKPSSVMSPSFSDIPEKTTVSPILTSTSSSSAMGNTSWLDVIPIFIAIGGVILCVFNIPGIFFILGKGFGTKIMAFVIAGISYIIGKFICGLFK